MLLLFPHHYTIFPSHGVKNTLGNDNVKYWSALKANTISFKYLSLSDTSYMITTMHTSYMTRVPSHTVTYPGIVSIQLCIQFFRRNWLFGTPASTSASAPVATAASSVATAKATCTTTVSSHASSIYTKVEETELEPWNHSGKIYYKKFNKIYKLSVYQVNKW